MRDDELRIIYNQWLVKERFFTDPFSIFKAGWNSRDSERESVTQALAILHSMIDGGEECRGRDSEISDVIRILEGGR